MIMSAINIIHPGQTLYAASSGTSHAAPAVAGAASLFYRYYKDHYDDTGAWPSPALTKAAIINSAKYLDGVSSGDILPSPHQGIRGGEFGHCFRWRAMIDRKTRSKSFNSPVNSPQYADTSVNQTNRCASLWHGLTRQEL